MIQADFVTLTPQGLYCKAGDFYLDPVMPAPVAIISHAHADHAIGGNDNVFATSATFAFMELRYGKNAGKNKHVISYRQKFHIKDVEITFFPAGHILGSAQILMNYQGISYLYTGDIKLQTDATCEPAQFVAADVLITETTFADPKVAHPAGRNRDIKVE